MKIALLGDIALFGRMSVIENPEIIEYFSEVADYLSQFDYVVGNLETPFSLAKKTYGAKSAYICSDPQSVTILKQLHINAVTLANNHIFDYGKEGYELTKKLLDDAGIKWFGTEGRNLKIECDGNKIVFAGYCCYSTNPLKCAINGGYGVNAYNIPETEKFISNSITEGYLPVIAVHAGLEHVNYPSIDHIRAARKLTEKGTLVYYGHHPHVIQGVEVYNGSLIAHSVGNFCFDDVYTTASKDKPLVELTENNRMGVIMELTVEDNKVKKWKEQIVYIGKGVNKLIMIETPPSVDVFNQELCNMECNPAEYNKKRQSLLDERTKERKAMRNLKWFMKRIRPRYFLLIMDMLKNKKLYVINVQQYL